MRIYSGIFIRVLCVCTVAPFCFTWQWHFCSCVNVHVYRGTFARVVCVHAYSRLPDTYVNMCPVQYVVLHILLTTNCGHDDVCVGFEHHAPHNDFI